MADATKLPNPIHKSASKSTSSEDSSDNSGTDDTLSEPEYIFDKCDTNTYRSTFSSNRKTAESDSSDSSSSDEITEKDLEEFMEKSKSPRNEIPRTKGEFSIKDLPPIDELKISLSDNDFLENLGTVQSIIAEDYLVIIKSDVDRKPLDMDSVLFTASRIAIGRVFETFGPVSNPFYSVRFNNMAEIETSGICIGDSISYVPDNGELTHFVFLEHTKGQKGSDASWAEDNEPPPEQREFSDDEQERAARRGEDASNSSPAESQRRRRKRAPRNATFPAQPTYVRFPNQQHPTFAHPPVFMMPPRPKLEFLPPGYTGPPPPPRNEASIPPPTPDHAFPISSFQSSTPSWGGKSAMAPPQFFNPHPPRPMPCLPYGPPQMGPGLVMMRPPMGFPTGYALRPPTITIKSETQETCASNETTIKSESADPNDLSFFSSDYVASYPGVASNTPPVTTPVVKTEPKSLVDLRYLENDSS